MLAGFAVSGLFVANVLATARPDRTAVTVPTVPTTVPTVATTVPTVATTVPTVATTVPTVATTVPTVATTVPTVATVSTVVPTIPTTTVRGEHSCHHSLSDNPLVDSGRNDGRHEGVDDGGRPARYARPCAERAGEDE